MQAIEKFHEVVNDRHRYGEEWKQRTGKRMLGCLCSYVPEEIMYAAGILPVRILGGHQPQTISERHMFSTYCPHSRDCLAQGLEGKYEYLDGIVHAHTCMHIRQAYNSWQLHVPTSFSYYLPMPPHLQSPHVKTVVVGEFAEFKRALENWTGEPISDQALDMAIDIYNTNRQLLRKVYELRKSNPSPISGVAATEMVLASLFMDKKEHNALLLQALAELEGSKPALAAKPRLMILGSENDDMQLISLIEELGTSIVIDDLCTGSRYFWNEVVPEPDRLTAIAARYINRPPCPLKDSLERRRFPHILKLAKDWQVSGVVIGHQKFCDPHGYDIPEIQTMLTKNGIPNLVLELDVTVAPGPVRTRIEAFLEMLEYAAVS